MNLDGTIVTDEMASGEGVGRWFDGGHHTVNHSHRQYARRGNGGFSIHTNMAEGFFSLVKRGHYGVYHKMSRKHLRRYCAEFTHRWTWRKQSDRVRTEAAIKAASGKRLLYETPGET